jgi:hypothetical protein
MRCIEGIPLNPMIKARPNTSREVFRQAVVLLLASLAIFQSQLAYAIAPPKYDPSKSIGGRDSKTTLLGKGATLLNDLGARVKQVPPTEKEIDSVVRVVKGPLVTFGDQALKSVRTRLKPEQQQFGCCSGPQASAEALARTGWMSVLWTVVGCLGVAFALLYGILVTR